MNIPCIESLCPQETHNRTLLFGCTLLKHGRQFWLLKPASEHGHARLLLRLSWSWTVLLPSDTHRKPITYNTTVLLPFVTYLLTLPRMCSFVYSTKRSGVQTTVMSNNRMNNELWGMWNDADVTNTVWGYCPGIFLEELRKTIKLSIRIDGHWAEIGRSTTETKLIL
jgi:hypothetical protein